MDQFNIPCKSASYGVFSVFGSIVFNVLPEHPVGQDLKYPEYPVWFSEPNLPTNIEDIYSFKWNICGFGVAEPTRSSDPLKVNLIIVPYWFTVIPMTALTALLLLKKPHSSNP